MLQRKCTSRIAESVQNDKIQPVCRDVKWWNLKLVVWLLWCCNLRLTASLCGDSCLLSINHFVAMTTLGFWAIIGQNRTTECRLAYNVHSTFILVSYLLGLHIALMSYIGPLTFRVRMILVLGYWVLGNIHRYWVVLFWGIFFVLTLNTIPIREQSAPSTCQWMII